MQAGAAGVEEGVPVAEGAAVGRHDTQSVEGEVGAVAETLAFADPVVTSPPAPYEKPPLNWTASGGAETVGVAPPASPGTMTRIP